MSIYDRKLAMKYLKDKFQAHSKLLEESNKSQSTQRKPPKAPRLP